MRSKVSSGAARAIVLLCAVMNGAASADEQALYQHVMKARQAAGADLRHHFYHRCFVDPNYSDTIADLRKAPAPMEPVKVFDNLYFLGQNAVSSWALRTNDGFVVFDTMNNPEEASQYIEGGMKQLGLDPGRITHIVILHEHADHFGGAKYLQQKYGSRIIASPIAWKGMADHKGRGANFIPAHDMDVTDGQRLDLGGTPVSFHVTPGHSDGTLSAIFATTDHGRPHVVGFFGGLGSPRTEANRQTIVRSFRRWRGIAAAAGVDTLIGNHQGQDYAVENLEFIKVRHASDPNPFVLGKDAYQRYFLVQEECTLAALARNNQRMPP